MAIIGGILFVLGLVVVGWNFYFGVLGPPETAGKCRLFIGSILLWLSAILLWHHPSYLWAALVASLFDAAGPIWYFGIMFWNWLVGSKRY